MPGPRGNADATRRRAASGLAESAGRSLPVTGEWRGTCASQFPCVRRRGAQDPEIPNSHSPVSRFGREREWGGGGPGGFLAWGALACRPSPAHAPSRRIVRSARTAEDIGAVPTVIEPEVGARSVARPASAAPAGTGRERRGPGEPGTRSLARAHFGLAASSPWGGRSRRGVCYHVGMTRQSTRLVTKPHSSGRRMRLAGSLIG